MKKVAFFSVQDYNLGCMSGEKLSPPAYSTKFTPQGVEITTVTRSKQSRFDHLGTPEAESTAGHEANHAVVGVKRGSRLRLVSRTPGPGYLGVTVFDNFDAVAAAAAHAHGGHGTGHDVSLIHAHGLSVEGASEAARDIVAKGNTGRQIAAVTEALEIHGTLDGVGVRRVMDEVDQDAEDVARGLKIVDVFVKSPDGISQEIKGIETEGDQDPIDMIPGKEVVLSKRTKWTLAA